MANPQIEDGFLQLANEVVEAFYLLNLSPIEWRCLWFVIRKTWGYKKKVDRIPLVQFSKRLRLDRRHVLRALKRLESKNIIVVSKDDNNFKTYRFQKDYSKWILSSRKAHMSSMEAHHKPMSSIEAPSVIHGGTQDVIFRGTLLSSIEAPSKEIKKEKKETIKETPAGLLSSFLNQNQKTREELLEQGKALMAQEETEKARRI